MGDHRHGGEAAELERRTAELDRERALLAAVLAQMPTGVLIAEAPTGRVVRANEQMGRLLGEEARYPESIADYGRWRGFRADGSRYQPHEWPLTRAVLLGEHVRERLEVELPDGRRVVHDVTAAPIRDAQGAIRYGVALVEEATEQERLEQAEREFVTNAAHELQTPLTAIISAAEVLDAGAKELPEDRDRFLAHIRRECARLSRLVHALLTLARAQSVGEQPPREPIDLRPLLDEAALALRPAGGVEVRVDCPADLRVRANRFLLEQAVAGLADNAAKYAPGGEIWLAASGTSEGVEITVTDEGAGVGPGEEERVFQRFYRGGERDRGGFGLGLAIVRQAVDALGGQVELARRDGGGTVARVRVPSREDA